VVATSVADLHSPSSNLNKATAVDEKGNVSTAPRAAEQPRHADRLAPDGTAFAGAPFPDMTCGNWTKGGARGRRCSATTTSPGRRQRVGQVVELVAPVARLRCRPPCAAPAARACSTASRRTDGDRSRRPAS
jgi:hypothetical protein